ncbi:MAG: hypothetical protein MUF04_02610 [Akkermansiaceae bacterium]|nr:hypothetical protein [Akkermansiaceae bacterium]
MKTTTKCTAILPLLAIGLMITPLQAQRPDGPPPGPPGPRQEARQPGNPERLQGAVRRMMELRKAGKQDEARAMMERLQNAAKNNPQLAQMLRRALEASRDQAAPPPPRTAERPAARQLQERPPVRGDARRGEGRPEARPHPVPPRPPVRPAAPPAPPRPQARPDVLRPAPPVACPQCKQCPLMRAVPPQGPRPGAAMRLLQARGPRPGMPAAPAMMKEAGKVRHLMLAAMHLKAAGYEEYATKAREEAVRVGKELKAKAHAKPAAPAPKAKAPAPKPEAKAKAPAPKPEQPKAKDREDDRQAAIVRELRKLNEQVGDLAKRVRKLEQDED